jgi:hypothetical protein
LKRNLTTSPNARSALKKHKSIGAECGKITEDNIRASALPFGVFKLKEMFRVARRRKLAGYLGLMLAMAEIKLKMDKEEEAKCGMSEDQK